MKLKWLIFNHRMEVKVRTFLLIMTDSVRSFNSKEIGNFFWIDDHGKIEYIMKRVLMEWIVIMD